MPFKVKNLYVLMAREVSTDAADQMNSIIKIIDKFIFSINRNQLEKDGVQLGKQQIALSAKYAVATLWIFSEKLKKETFFNFRINIFDPTGKNLGGPEQENLLPAGKDRISINFNMEGLPITSAGEYKLNAEIATKNGEVLAKADYPFRIELADGSLQGIATT